MHTSVDIFAIINLVKPPPPIQYIYISFLLHPIRTNTFSLIRTAIGSCPFYFVSEYDTFEATALLCIVI